MSHSRLFYKNKKSNNFIKLTLILILHWKTKMIFIKNINKKINITLKTNIIHILKYNIYFGTVLCIIKQGHG